MPQRDVPNAKRNRSGRKSCDGAAADATAAPPPAGQPSQKAISNAVVGVAAAAAAHSLATNGSGSSSAQRRFACQVAAALIEHAEAELRCLNDSIPAPPPPSSAADTAAAAPERETSSAFLAALLLAEAGASSRFRLALLCSEALLRRLVETGGAAGLPLDLMCSAGAALIRLSDLITSDPAAAAFTVPPDRGFFPAAATTAFAVQDLPATALDIGAWARLHVRCHAAP